MIDNLKICVEAVLPMFLTLGIGYIIRLSKIVTDAELNKFNRLVFRALLPIMMFSNIYSSQIKDVVNVRLMGFTLLCIMVVYFVGTFVTLKIEKNSKSRGAMIQAIYRSNFVIMGLPIATNIYGHSNVGLTAVIVAVVVPVFNILAVITLETYRGTKVNVRTIVFGVIKNPLIIGAVTGILFTLFNLKLPGVIEDTVSSVAVTATPMALIILGASFKFGTIKRCKRDLTIAVVARLIVVPGICLTAAALLGIRDLAFITMVGVFASPCAISSFTMALEMDSDADLAGNAVVMTSLLSCFTMFGWLLVFKTAGVF